MPRTSLAWGIAGLGRIARTFASQLPQSRTGRLAAVASRDPAHAAAFGASFGLGSDACHGSHDALLDDPRVEAVYIATPHPGHGELAIRAAARGKHILCEKPLTLNAADARRVVEAARAHDVFLMEAFMYRPHPLTARVLELAAGGAIGTVRYFRGSWGSAVRFDPHSRLFDPALGGGAILDVGCYPISYARRIAGALAGAAFENPARLEGHGTLGPTGVDDFAIAHLEFPCGLMAHASTSLSLPLDNALHLHGTDGWLTVQHAWRPPAAGGPAEILLRRAGREPETIIVDTPDPLWAIEADHVAQYLDARQSPAMSWDDTLGNMETLDRWRATLRPGMDG
jgi:predicted dehydrogenase